MCIKKRWLHHQIRWDGVFFLHYMHYIQNYSLYRYFFWFEAGPTQYARLSIPSCSWKCQHKTWKGGGTGRDFHLRQYFFWFALDGPAQYTQRVVASEMLLNLWFIISLSRDSSFFREPTTWDFGPGTGGRVINFDGKF